MRPLMQEIPYVAPELVMNWCAREPGACMLRSSMFDLHRARYSFIAARPFLTFTSSGAECVQRHDGKSETMFGDPWRLLEQLLERYELLDEQDIPFPLGGCFGYWGYDLKQFVEPKLRCRTVDDLELPTCWVGFYDSLLAFDHQLQKVWIISTGLQLDGSRSDRAAEERLRWWMSQVAAAQQTEAGSALTSPRGAAQPPAWSSTFSRDAFVEAVRKAQRYIRAGDIYQVNLAQRLTAQYDGDPWSFYQTLQAISPAPFSAFINCGDFQLASSSPELFLRMTGRHATTRPIKGTRPRSADPNRDAQLTYELQTSPKEMAELVMITDLLRNDLGRVCSYGSVQTPELVRLERYAQVQHLVSTVEGTLRLDVSHFAAMSQCFPGGSITGAPKFRAMQIIDELEPVSRGPYTGCLGYVGFNHESQLSIIIRTAILRGGETHYYAGAGIVDDSVPEAEYEETLAKARGFLQSLDHARQRQPQSAEPRFPER